MEIIKEQDYLRIMTETVLPDLQKRRRRHVFQTRDLQLSCEFYRADRPRGAVIISHGFTESAAKYREVIYYFLQMGYHVCIPEHCGHGHSGRLVSDPSLVHVDHCERYIADLLNISGLVKKSLSASHKYTLILFGHSMGGGIAAAAAAAQPQLFDAVILSSPMIRPLTGRVPWRIARCAAGFACLFGKAASYAPGQRPYDGRECFADSASTSEVRFTFYRSLRKNEPLYQQNAPSCGWLHEAFRLSRRLLWDSAKRLPMPVLLCQAGSDSFVSEKAQNQFVKKSGGHIRLVRFPEARHEIYSSEDTVLTQYWAEIEQFLQKASHSA